MSVQIKLNGAKLISSGVRIGDRVIIKNAPPNIFNGNPDPNKFSGEFLVVGINDEETLLYDAFLNGATLNISLNPTTTGTVNYEVVHILSKDEQVDELVSYAKGIGYKRVVAIWPPSGKQQDGTIVNGSFIAASFASTKSTLPAQQGMTNYPINSVYELSYRNYFKKSQLKRLVDAGWCVFVQDAPGLPIHSLHQKTTDSLIFENSEISCVDTIDKISADIKAMYKPLIGIANISQDYIGVLHQRGDNYLFEAKNQKAPLCGALIIDGKIDSIRAQLNGQNLDIPKGTVEVTYSVEIGKPGNWIKVKLLVS